MKLQVTLCKWKDLPDDPFLFPDGTAAHKHRHRAFMQDVKRENARFRGSSEIAENNPVSQEAAATAAAAAAAAGEMEMEAEAGGDGQGEEADEENKELVNLSKRALDASATLEMSKMRKIDSGNFLELPVIPGIDTSAPIRL